MFLWVSVDASFALVGLAERIRAEPLERATWTGKNDVTFTLPLRAAAMAMRWAREGEGTAGRSV